LKNNRNKNKTVFLKLLLFLIAVVSISFSCNRNLMEKEGIVLAQVGNRYLYEDDIKGLVPPGTSVYDSIRMVKSYIRKWVETRLIVEQALKNLPEEKLNFDKQLEEYKNSLIIFQYETELVKQKLDTVVDDKEIEAYYKNHLNDFELKENIVKAVYAVLPNSTEGEDEAKHFKKILELPDSLMIDSLEFYASNLDIHYSADTSNWIRFNDLLKKFPIETYNQELFLKNHRIINIKDDKNIYLIKFVNFKIKDETSPLDFEKNYIKSIIINKRKNLLLKKMKNDIIEKGIKEKLFVIY